MKSKSLELFSVVAQIVFYGIYVSCCAVSMYCMRHVRGRKTAPNKVVVGISVALFVIITMFCSVSIVRVVSMFVIRGDNPAGSGMGSLQIRIIKGIRFSAFFLVDFLINGLLIYRLYMIYFQSLRIIAFPALLMLVYLGSVVSQIVVLTRIWPLTSQMENSWKIRAWTAMNLALHIFICIYSTFLIGYRIVQHGSAFRLFGTKNRFGPVLYIIVESAFVYTMLNLLLLVLYLAKREDGYCYSILLTIIPPLIGMNNSITLIYISLGICTDTPQTQLAPSSLRFSSDSQTTMEQNRDEHVVVLVTTERVEECEWTEGNEMLGRRARKVNASDDSLQAKSATLLFNEGV